MAAGRGERMESKLPKVLHPLAGRPLVHYVIELARNVGSERILLVIGGEGEMVREATGGMNVEYVVQEKPLGTGDAVKSCRAELENFTGDVLVLSGDVPLLKPFTVERARTIHKRENATATVFTFKPDDPTGYGRIIRGGNGELVRIVEQKDCSKKELDTGEVNGGIYFFKSDMMFEALKEINNENISGEFYLTDIISLFADRSEPLTAYLVDDPVEAAGVNTLEQLSQLDRYLIKENRGQ